MRITILNLLGFLFFQISLAQPPQTFQYQAVMRNVNGEVITNQQVNLTINLIKGNVNGLKVFSESYNVNTNDYGMVTLTIGSQNTTAFASIDWGDGPYFIQVFMDDKLLGTSQLLSVPYALYAQTAEKLNSPPEETDPLFVSSAASNLMEADVDKLSNLSGTNTGDQDLTGLATNEALEDAVNNIRRDLPDTTNLANISALNDTASAIRNDIPDVSGLVREENDPVFQNSAASEISDSELKKLRNLTGKNTGDQDLSNLVTRNALDDTIAILREEIPTVTKHEVGDFAQGGIVFWVDESGQHGLACAKKDLDSLKWNAGNAINTMAMGDGPMAGKLNTAIIIASQRLGDGSQYAARACNELQTTQNGRDYADWYLPSFGELLLLHEHIDLINSVAAANGGDSIDTNESYYWTSNEINDSFARLIWFTHGNAFEDLDSKFFNHKVRPVREF